MRGSNVYGRRNCRAKIVSGDSGASRVKFHHLDIIDEPSDIAGSLGGNGKCGDQPAKIRI